ncbi:hypothetical protein NL676_021737 [Syzygium grande]|nr:hypothetical protein NL676_021737 [Syzygium grande]
MNLGGSSLYLVGEDGEVLLPGLPNTCMFISDDSFSIQVYVLVVPDQPLIGFAHQKHTFLSLLIALLSMEVITILSFVFLVMRALRREMHLRAILIKQMEATWQAESKSMSKSNAFAQASHDIPSSLAGITGLIEISYDEVSPGSELVKNLKQMEACAKDLLALLNSILDTSKIEAGKMQLEEEEFDLAQLLEVVVDLYHPVAMRKGIDVVLDPSDGSLLKHSLVKEFVFEVNDTGKGIPKEKWKSVFENYSQVKETAQGQGGTGLGLGIVQSLVCPFLYQLLLPSQMLLSEIMRNLSPLPTNPRYEVRLMGGDIEIAHKDIGERGTCFRFNVFLAPCEASAKKSSDRDLEPGAYSMACSLGLTVHTPSPALSFHSSRQALNPKSEDSRVVLLIQSEERRRICQSFMERLGIKVLIASQWQDLRMILKKVLTKIDLSQHSSSGKSDLSLRSVSSDKSPGKARDVPLSSQDRADRILPVYDQSNSRKNEAGFMLLIIDASSGSFRELCKAVAEFRQFMPSNCYKVVWLDKPTMRNIEQRAIRDSKIDPCDIVMSKPFHGTRQFRAIRLLPEFGGFGLRTLSEQAEERPYQHAEVTKLVAQETGNTSREKPLSGKKVLVADDSDVMRKLAIANLLTLGATINLCKNGEEAVKSIREGLSHDHPYDYILMDCQVKPFGFTTRS